MPSRSRREFVVAACASLLYGARLAFASEAAGGQSGLGVLLPLASSAFGAPAESVKRGIETAARVDPAAAFVTTIYATSEGPANIVAGYQQALADVPRLIIGPLTRNGVTALLAQLQPGVPVLALNVPENDAPLPEGCYAFSLQVETEARQVASMAFAEGRRSALTLADEQPLAQRTQRAFAEEFTRQGGRIVARFAYRNSAPDLMALREAATGGQCDTVFLALDAARARLVRGYVDGPAQTFATSRILEGEPDRLRDAELNGVRFVAMPWLLQPDHPAVMVYAGANAQPPAPTNMERLYGFGIDPYRLAVAFVTGTDLTREPLDGVTGRIHLGPDRHFVRELTAAQFIVGRAVPLATRPCTRADRKRNGRRPTFSSARASPSWRATGAAASARSTSSLGMAQRSSSSKCARAQAPRSAARPRASAAASGASSLPRRGSTFPHARSTHRAASMPC